MQTIQPFTINSWQHDFSDDEKHHAIEKLETGHVLFFPDLSFKLESHEISFLAPHYVDPKSKNISYDSNHNRLKGVLGSDEDRKHIQNLLARFSDHARTLITNLFPHYLPALKQARTSLRTIEVSGRRSSYRKDDKRLHVDAFPATPNHGHRLLRVFCNINPHGMARVWRLGEPFEKVATRFIPQIKPAFPGSAALLEFLRITKTRRTEYDHIMLNMHNRMKADEHYQKIAEQIEFHFPAATTWIVQTDQVSHAAMSGQHLLEQTFYLPVDAMRDPLQSPLKILEKMTGRKLA